MFEQTVN